MQLNLGGVEQLRKLLYENYKYVSKSIKDLPRLYLKDGDLLFNRTNSYELVGKSGVFNSQEIQYTFASYLIRISLFLEFISPEFINAAINSIYFRQTQIEPEITQQCGQANFNGTKLRNTLIPLPPLAEQERIVAKVDELMALCDRAEAAQQTRNTLRQNLRASALDALMNATSDTELDTAWGFVREQWMTVSSGDKDVEGLRKLVLEAASRGRLVPQLPAEGNGENTLEIALQERKEKFKRGEAQKPKTNLPVSKDEWLYPLPKNWTWTRIEDICTYIVDCLHRTPKYETEGYPAIRTSDIKPGLILYEQAKRVGEEEYKRQTQRLLPSAGDIFYSREGNYGIAAAVPLNIEMCLSQRMMQFRLASEIYPDFFSWMMNAPVMFNQAVSDAAGMTVPHVNIRSLRKFVFPLPPLAEQKRIVAKVDELMKQCDRLETTLRKKQQIAEALVASAISHLSA